MTDFPINAPTLSYGISLSKKYRYLEANFGDGYSQRAGDGLNTISEEWRMVWDIITSSEKNILIDFFDQQQGYLNFNFTAPGDSVSKKWIANTPSVTPINATYYKVECVFQRVYDI